MKDRSVDALAKYFPFIGWMRTYKRKYLRGDLIAGLTVAVILIPQGMAYAMLAGLPPIIGLYASLVPPFIYALFGSSRQLAVGPVAMDSLLVATGVGAIAKQGSADYVALAVLLAGMVGVIQLLMGIGRVGFLVNFISQPVISGFTSAVALIIGFSQLKNLFGIDIPRSHHIHEVLWNALKEMYVVNVSTLVIGLGSILILLLMKKLSPRLPRQLILIIAATVVVCGLQLNEIGVRIVGAIPEGLPSFSLPDINWLSVQSLLPIAFTISLVAFMEAISVGKAIASRHKYSLNANQELIGIGLANISAGLFNAYPVTGGFSRSAVNDRAGANTGFATIITTIMIAFTLMFFTPLLYYLPVATLAAIIMVSVFGLIDFRRPAYLFKIKKIDCVLLVLTFLSTLILGIESGILIGVSVSLFLFIVQTTTPHYAILGRLPGTDQFRNIKRFPEVETEDDVLILRIDASFYFANVNFLKEKLEGCLYNPERKLKSVIIDLSSVNYLDSSADETLRDIFRKFKEHKIDLYFANIKGPVRDVIKQSGLYNEIGACSFFFSVNEVMHHLKSRKKSHKYCSEELINTDTETDTDTDNTRT